MRTFCFNICFYTTNVTISYTILTKFLQPCWIVCWSEWVGRYSSAPSLQPTEPPARSILLLFYYLLRQFTIISCLGLSYNCTLVRANRFSFLNCDPTIPSWRTTPYSITARRKRKQEHVFTRVYIKGWSASLQSAKFTHSESPFTFQVNIRLSSYLWSKWRSIHLSTVTTLMSE